MEHVQINHWADFQRFGINPLTGEACAYSMRLLCDLNEGGAALVKDYLGLPPDSALAPNWNLQVDNQPAIASIMLAREQFQPLALFIAWKEDYDFVIQLNRTDNFNLLSNRHEYAERWLAMALENPDKYTVYRNPNPNKGSRNTHAMSGRTL